MHAKDQHACCGGSKDALVERDGLFRRCLAHLLGLGDGGNRGHGVCVGYVVVCGLWSKKKGMNECNVNGKSSMKLSED